MGKKYTFTVLALSALLLLGTSVYAIQSGSFGGQSVGISVNMGGSGCVEDGNEGGNNCGSPKDCEDPGATGKNICRGRDIVVSACKDMCDYYGGRDQCGWTPNSKEQCKAQCSVVNGCLKG